MMNGDERFCIAVLCQYEDDGGDPEVGTDTEGTGDTDSVDDDDTQTSGETMNE